jgi:mRNA-degrading endonuclease toxin of MazEF toxin-antitoxin module
MTPGDICIGKFPPGGTPGARPRPVLLLTGPLGTVPEFVVAYISSVIPTQLLPGDILLDPARSDHASMNLRQLSVLRMHKISTVHSRDLLRYLGVMPPSMFAQAQSHLRSVLNL